MTNAAESVFGATIVVMAAGLSFRRRRLVCASLVTVLVVSACSTREHVSASRPEALEVCATTDQREEAMPSQEAVVSLLVGTWLLCQAPSVWGTDDEAGLEFSADGRWRKLRRAGSGALVRVEGWGDEGSWAAVDTSYPNAPPSYVLKVVVDPYGTTSIIPTFSAAASRMHLINYTNVADYVRASGSDTVAEPSPGEGQDACTAPERGVVAPLSLEAFEELFVGTWLSCSGDLAFFGSADEAGVEISADHQWWTLRRDGAGGLVRLGGPLQEGTWEMGSACPPAEGPPICHVWMHNGVGFNVMSPVFALGQMKMRVNSMGTIASDARPFTADYSKAPASQPTH